MTAIAFMGVNVVEVFEKVKGVKKPETELISGVLFDKPKVGSTVSLVQAESYE